MTRAALLFLAFSTLAACAEVGAWERETLTTARMQLDPDPDDAALVAARRRTREEGNVTGGAAGNASSSGGGCGCN